MCGCAPGFTVCQSDAGSVCVDLSTDPAHCGACDQACVACETCFLSACTASSFLVAASPLPFGGGDAGLYPNAVAIGDFNGDGFNDLAVLGGAGDNESSLLEINFGDGRGGFPRSSLQAAPHGELIYSVAAGDINGDGLADLVIAVIGTGSPLTGSGFYVFQGNDDGGQTVLGPFSSDLSEGTNTTDVYLVGLVVADLNSDGLSDVVVSSPDTGLVSVSYSRGDGSFDKISLSTAQHPGSTPELATGDLDGDGRADLAVATEDSEIVYLQAGDGGLVPGGQISLTFPLLAIASPFLMDGTQAYFLSDGQPTQGPYLTFPALFAGDTPFTALGADLNGDGMPDYLVTDLQTLVVWLNHGLDGGFGQPTEVVVGTAGSFGLNIAVGDLDGDGRPDVAIAGGVNGFESATSIVLNRCTQ
jgi:hypothetical protein